MFIVKTAPWDFTNDAVVEALMLMKNIMEFANPDILLEGASDGGVNGTPDEVAFAAQRAAYYTKYFNAPTRMAEAGGFADSLGFGGLPTFEGGEGFTAFWTTGTCLLKYGQNKEEIVEWVKAVTYSDDVWRDSIFWLRKKKGTALLLNCHPISLNTLNGMPMSPIGCSRMLL